MMVSKDRRRTREPSTKGIGGAVGWPIAIALAAAMLAGIFAGSNQAAIENGGEPLPAWLGPLVGIGFCAIAGAFYLRAYCAVWRDRKSVVEGKSVSDRVVLGGRRTLYKKNDTLTQQCSDTN